MHSVVYLLSMYICVCVCVCVCVRARARACTKSLQSCPTLCNPLDYSPPGFSVHGFSRQEYTKVGCHALLQGIFLTQGSNPPLLCLLDWQMGSLSLTPPGKPINIHTYICVCYIYGDRDLWVFSSAQHNPWNLWGYTYMYCLPSMTLKYSR